MIGLTGWRDEKIEKLSRTIDLLEYSNRKYEHTIERLQSEIDEHSTDKYNAEIASRITKSIIGISDEDAMILMGVVRDADKRRADDAIKRAMLIWC